ncbi:MAG: D-alanyl-D-alanine carboxypeptidase [Verrucomicrobia bacterium]|nr:D-alanyl-D-alanine carboxypeptidase [Verrucomicrobiota bacterium]
MRLSCRLGVVFCLAALLPTLVFAATTKRAAPTRPESDGTANYKGAIVLDAATGNVVFEDRADYVGPPASVAKLMTFLVVHDRLQRGDLSLQTPVLTTAEAAKTGGSQVYLAEKEVFPVEELLYALMIASANDAATALAIHVAGSRAAFVEAMNARARELGMAQTTFRSPHGLPPSSRQLSDSDVTSPRDLAKLSLHLLRHTDILKYTSVKTRTFRPGPKQIDMVNHNHLLGKVAGVDGLKTGFTRGAGFCLAATAYRNNRRVVVVTMGSPDSKSRDIKIAELIEKGFSALPVAAPFQAPSNSPIQPAPRVTPPPPPPAPAKAPAAAEGDAVIKFSIPKR